MGITSSDGGKTYTVEYDTAEKRAEREKEQINSLADAAVCIISIDEDGTVAGLDTVKNSIPEGVDAEKVEQSAIDKFIEKYNNDDANTKKIDKIEKQADGTYKITYKETEPPVTESETPVEPPVSPESSAATTPERPEEEQTDDSKKKMTGA